MIDRRQYYMMFAMICMVTGLYFFAIVYVVYKSTISKSDDENGIITLLESILDVIASLSNNVFSFVFALLMNFFLLMGLYGLNLISFYLAELAKSIE